MKPSDLKGKSAKELNKMVEDFQEELFRLKIRLSTGELPQNTSIRKIKKDVARVLTQLQATSLQAGAKS